MVPYQGSKLRSGSLNNVATFQADSVSPLSPEQITIRPLSASLFQLNLIPLSALIEKNYERRTPLG